jgi:hypothetical protein
LSGWIPLSAVATVPASGRSTDAEIGISTYSPGGRTIVHWLFDVAVRSRRRTSGKVMTMLDRQARMFFKRRRAVLLCSLALVIGLPAPSLPELSYAASAPPATEPLAPPLPLEEYRRRIISGGPPKDGIPAIDEPRFEDAARASRYLQPDDVVFGVVRSGEARAYPQRILVWHEVVNDRLGDDNVVISYCPLTGSALGFFRGDTSFGVSGLLLNSNVVMYDRATDSRWPQLLATAVAGSQAKQTLQGFQVTWTTWERWQARYPDTTVLSRRTGYARDYDRDPYGSYNPLQGYYAPRTPYLFSPLREDPRFDAKEVFIAARTADGAIAFRKSSLRRQGMLRGTIGGTAYTAVYDPGLDTAHVFRDPDGILSPQRLQFGPQGVLLDGAPVPLTSVVSYDVMWFAWAGFYPDTEVYE